ncbi:MAG: acyl-CoA dehydrogenase family protein [Burkholderiaceae bacterium]
MAERRTDFPAGEEARFREQIRNFVRSHLGDALRKKADHVRPLDKEESVQWQQSLAAQGWGAPHWPVEWGGTNWSMRQQFVFEEEMALCGAPPGQAFNTRMIGPILIAMGTEEQKRKFLPRALTYDDWWCQGYSEPSSGSDLASLKTKAVRDGDDYIVNGSKIWTSHAQYANWMFCLVRTSSEGKKQQGISFLLIDMNTPGIRLQPIKHFYGAHVFNQIFFDDVRVPVANRVGAENEGWTVAKALLEHERLFASRHAEARKRLRRLLRVATTTRINGRAAIEHDHHRHRIASLAVKVRALEFATMRALEKLTVDGTIGFYSSTMKLQGTQVNQWLDEALFDICGPDALAADASYSEEASAEKLGLVPDARYVAESRYFFRGPAIAGGSAEVQRGIISKRILNMG